VGCESGVELGVVGGGGCHSGSWFIYKRPRTGEFFGGCAGKHAFCVVLGWFGNSARPWGAALSRMIAVRVVEIGVRRW